MTRELVCFFVLIFVTGSYIFAEKCVYHKLKKITQTRPCNQAINLIFKGGWLVDSPLTIKTNKWPNNSVAFINNIKGGIGNCAMYKMVYKETEDCCRGWTGVDCDIDVGGKRILTISTFGEHFLVDYQHGQLEIKSNVMGGCGMTYFTSGRTTASCSHACLHGSCTGPDTCTCAETWSGRSCDENIKAVTDSARYCYIGGDCKSDKLFNASVVPKDACCSDGGDTSWGHQEHNATQGQCLSCLKEKSLATAVTRNKRVPFRTCVSGLACTVRTFDGVTYNYCTHCTFDLLNTADIVISMHTDELLQQKVVTIRAIYRQIRYTLTNDSVVMSSDNQDERLEAVNIGDIREHAVQIGELGVNIVGDSIFIAMPRYDLRVRRDNNIQVFVTVGSHSPLRKDQIQGACGNYDDDLTDEVKLANNVQEARKFGLVWTDTSCHSRHREITYHSEIKKAAEIACSVLSSKLFERCHSLIDVRSYVQSCIEAYSLAKHNNDKDLNETHCKAVGAYASVCAMENVVIHWRTDAFCPKHCPANMVYRQCGPSCKPTCGFPIGSYLKNECDMCCPGCHCEEGLVLHNGACIQPTNCPCVHKHAAYDFGQTLYINETCQMCACDHFGHWNCTETLCRATCSIYGPGVLTTFDGEEFRLGTHNATCGYTLVSVLKTKLEIKLRARLCENQTSAVCATGFEVKSGKQHISVELTLSGGFRLLDLVMNTHRDLPFFNGGFYVRQTTGNSLIADFNGFLLTIYANNYLAISTDQSSHFGIVRGLCGNLNNLISDERLLPSGVEADSDSIFVAAFSDNKCGSILSLPQLPANEQQCASLKLLYEAFNQTQSTTENIYRICMTYHDPSNICAAILKLTVTADISLTSLLDYPLDDTDIMEVCTNELMSCEKGLVYREDIDICTTNCLDLAFGREKCHHKIIHGCSCADGFYRNNNGTCVPKSQCSCLNIATGKYYKPGLVDEIPCHECHCTRGKLRCQERGCEKIVCPKDQVAIVTKNASMAECLNYKCPDKYSNQITCTDNSSYKKKCVCKEGYIMTQLGTCVQFPYCPCYHEGVWHKNGTDIMDKCFLKRCNNGIWMIIEKTKCQATCIITGSETQIETFDGTTYSFRAKSAYTLVKTQGDGQGFKISFRNLACESNQRASCHKIDINFMGIHMELVAGAGVIVGNKTYSLDEPQKIGIFKVMSTTLYIVINFLDVTVYWSGGLLTWIQVSSRWDSKLEGLCGTYDYNTKNDFHKPDGSIDPDVVSFTDSWKEEDIIVTHQNESSPCQNNPEKIIWSKAKCNIIKSSQAFQQCREAMPQSHIDKYVADCEKTTCWCNGDSDSDCICDTIAHFATVCDSLGHPAAWRHKHLCPVQCAGDMVYSSNHRLCKTTCLDLINNVTQCDILGGVEGCFCPPGKVWHESRCIPSTQCPCYHGMYLYDPGTVLKKKDCEICVCGEGKLVCRSTNCSECLQDEFKCITDGMCIHQSDVCNGIFNCYDGSDESSDLCEKKNCSSEQFQCKHSGECIPSSQVCDDIAHCDDGSDEHKDKCKSVCDHRCQDGRCLYKDYICDGYFDCIDGSDEVGCATACEHGHFKCNKSGECIKDHYVCDGHDDCGDGFDELGCASLKASPHFETEISTSLPDVSINPETPQTTEFSGEASPERTDTERQTTTEISDGNVDMETVTTNVATRERKITPSATAANQNSNAQNAIVKDVTYLMNLFSHKEETVDNTLVSSEESTMSTLSTIKLAHITSIPHNFETIPGAPLETSVLSTTDSEAAETTLETFTPSLTNPEPSMKTSVETVKSSQTNNEMTESTLKTFSSRQTHSEPSTQITEHFTSWQITNESVAETTLKTFTSEQTLSESITETTFETVIPNKTNPETNLEAITKWVTSETTNETSTSIQKTPQVTLETSTSKQKSFEYSPKTTLETVTSRLTNYETQTETTLETYTTHPLTLEISSETALETSISTQKNSEATPTTLTTHHTTPETLLETLTSSQEACTKAETTIESFTSLDLTTTARLTSKQTFPKSTIETSKQAPFESLADASFEISTHETTNKTSSETTLETFTSSQTNPERTLETFLSIQTNPETTLETFTSRQITAEKTLEKLTSKQTLFESSAKTTLETVPSIHTHSEPQAETTLDKFTTYWMTSEALSETPLEVTSRKTNIDSLNKTTAEAMTSSQTVSETTVEAVTPRQTNSETQAETAYETTFEANPETVSETLTSSQTNSESSVETTLGTSTPMQTNSETAETTLETSKTYPPSLEASSETTVETLTSNQTDCSNTETTVETSTSLDQTTADILTSKQTFPKTTYVTAKIRQTNPETIKIFTPKQTTKFLAKTTLETVTSSNTNSETTLLEATPEQVTSETTLEPSITHQKTNKTPLETTLEKFTSSQRNSETTYETFTSSQTNPETQAETDHETTTMEQITSKASSETTLEAFTSSKTNPETTVETFTPRQTNPEILAESSTMHKASLEASSETVSKLLTAGQTNTESPAETTLGTSTRMRTTSETSSETTFGTSTPMQTNSEALAKTLEASTTYPPTPEGSSETTVETLTSNQTDYLKAETTVETSTSLDLTTADILTSKQTFPKLTLVTVQTTSESIHETFTSKLATLDETTLETDTPSMTNPETSLEVSTSKLTPPESSADRTLETFTSSQTNPETTLETFTSIQTNPKTTLETFTSRQITAETTLQKLTSKQTLFESSAKTTLETVPPIHTHSEPQAENTLEKFTKHWMTSEASSETPHKATSRKTSPEFLNKTTSEAMTSNQIVSETTVEAVTPRQTNSETQAEISTAYETTFEASPETVFETLTSSQTNSESSVETTLGTSTEIRTSSETSSKTTLETSTPIQTNSETLAETSTPMQKNSETLAETILETSTTYSSTPEARYETTFETLTSKQTDCLKAETTVETSTSVDQTTADILTTKQTSPKTTLVTAKIRQTNPETTLELFTPKQATKYLAETTLETARSSNTNSETTFLEATPEQVTSETLEQSKTHQTTIKTPSKTTLETFTSNQTNPETTYEIFTSNQASPETSKQTFFGSSVERTLETVTSEQTNSETQAETDHETSTTEWITSKASSETTLEVFTSSKTNPETTVEAFTSRQTNPEIQAESSTVNEKTLEASSETVSETLTSSQTNPESPAETTFLTSTEMWTTSETTLETSTPMQTNSETLAETMLETSTTYPLSPKATSETIVGTLTTNQTDCLKAETTVETSTSLDQTAADILKPKQTFPKATLVTVQTASESTHETFISKLATLDETTLETDTPNKTNPSTSLEVSTSKLTPPESSEDTTLETFTTHKTTNETSETTLKTLNQTLFESSVETTFETVTSKLTNYERQAEASTTYETTLEASSETASEILTSSQTNPKATAVATLGTSTQVWTTSEPSSETNSETFAETTLETLERTTPTSIVKLTFKTNPETMFDASSSAQTTSESSVETTLETFTSRQTNPETVSEITPETSTSTSVNTVYESSTSTLIKYNTSEFEISRQSTASEEILKEVTTTTQEIYETETREMTHLVNTTPVFNKDCPRECLSSWSCWSACPRPCKGIRVRIRSQDTDNPLCKCGEELLRQAESCSCNSTSLSTPAAGLPCQCNSPKECTSCFEECEQSCRAFRSQALCQKQDGCSPEESRALQHSPVVPDWEEILCTNFTPIDGSTEQLAARPGRRVISASQILTKANSRSPSAKCYNGCKCPDGYLMDDDGFCTPSNYCPCYDSKGVEVPYNCTYIDPSSCKVCHCSENGGVCEDRQNEFEVLYEWTVWSDWSPCSSSCGTGTSFRNRTGQYLGCSTRQEEFKPCSSQECHCVSQKGDMVQEGQTYRPDECHICRCVKGDFVCKTDPSRIVNGEFEEWSQWSSCGGNCSLFSKTRSRYCKPPVCGGHLCDDAQMETSVCSWEPCCQVFKLSDWTLCTQTCGPQSGSRSRHRIYADENSSKKCESYNYIDTCGLCSCDDEKQTSIAWSEWTSCTNEGVDCGWGKRTRHRSVSNECVTKRVESTQTEPCFMGACNCSKHLVWSNNSLCERKCHMDPPVDCSLHISGGCICPYNLYSNGDQCVLNMHCPNECVYNNVTYQDGQHFSCDGCKICQCVRGQIEKVSRKECPDVRKCNLSTHHLVPSGDGCCLVDCNPQETCTVHQASAKHAVINNCRSVEEVTQQVCAGPCPTRSDLLDYTTLHETHLKCKACSPRSTVYKAVEFKCNNGTTIIHPLPFIMECSCEV